MDGNVRKSTTARKHLVSHQALMTASHAIASGPNEHHHPGNGLRVHCVYFLTVSLAALLVLIVFIAVASAM